MDSNRRKTKRNIIKTIIKEVAKDLKLQPKFERIDILPIIKENIFTFTYEVQGITLPSVKKIYIKIVSGGKFCGLSFILLPPILFHSSV